VRRSTRLAHHQVPSHRGAAQCQMWVRLLLSAYLPVYLCHFISLLVYLFTYWYAVQEMREVGYHGLRLVLVERKVFAFSKWKVSHFLNIFTIFNQLYNFHCLLLPSPNVSRAFQFRSCKKTSWSAYAISSKTQKTFRSIQYLETKRNGGKIWEGRCHICREEEDSIHILLKYSETWKWTETFLSIKWLLVVKRSLTRE
jgi:hypothetical protein